MMRLSEGRFKLVWALPNVSIFARDLSSAKVRRFCDVYNRPIMAFCIPRIRYSGRKIREERPFLPDSFDLFRFVGFLPRQRHSLLRHHRRHLAVQLRGPQVRHLLDDVGQVVAHLV